jgi:6,7-dimethyl-8-ribityllumazine synthase
MLHPSIPAPSIELDGHGLRIGIIVARYNWHITGSMLALAREELSELGVSPSQITVQTVPGSFELAMLAQAMLTNDHYDALICFGCVIKGATRHDVVVGDASAQGIQQIALQHTTPIIFGVMCAENQQQAEERIVRARECAKAAVEMTTTIQRLRDRHGSTRLSENYQEV